MPGSLPPTSVGNHHNRAPDRILLLLWCLFGLLMIGVAVSDYLRGGGRAVWQPLTWEGSSMVFGGLLLLLQRHLSPHFVRYIGFPRRWFLHHLKWLPLAALLFIGAVFATRHGIYALLGQRYHHDPVHLLIPYEGAKFAMFAGFWLGIIYIIDSHAQWQRQQQRLLMLQKALSEAQLARLSAQLRPHFLFNALNTISALMHMDVARADALLAKLGDLLRASLQAEPATQHDLGRELQLLELYAQIMVERFADRVRIDWEIDPAAVNVAVPALLLQPLLENAFKHAVERSISPVGIRVQARRAGGRLELSLANTALNASASPIEGVGLRNCRERLAVLHGERAALELFTTSDQFEVRLRLPWRELS